MRLPLSLAALALGVALLPRAHAQTLTPLVNAPPADGIVYGYLMTDGRVLLQGGNLSDWYTLTPDANGSYLDGTWTQVASLPAPYAPDATSGAVLPDGRVLITGGEYNGGSFALDTESAVYDPAQDSWKVFAGPKGWTDIGDSPGTILPNGQFLLGEKTTQALALLDARTLTWTILSSSGKSDENAEEGYTLMPDGSVLTTDVTNAPNAERLDTRNWTWSSLGSTKVNLKFTWQGINAQPIPWRYRGKTYYYTPAGEIGPDILRPDGTVFAAGAINTVPKRAYYAHTAVYVPSKTPGGVGTWHAGPNFQHNDDAGDQFAVLLPNGHVLVQANVGGYDKTRAQRAARIASLVRNNVAFAGNSCPGVPPFHLYEFDGKSLTLEPTLLNTCGISPNMLVLPDGGTLIGGFAEYTSSGSPSPAWAPTITSVPASLAHGTTATLSGTQLTGLSQANAFGDEFGAPTDYPLIRITNTATGHVVYCRTHDWSDAGVATGTKVVTTSFDIPASTETGPSTIAVVTNGIASHAVAVTVS